MGVYNSRDLLKDEEPQLAVTNPLLPSDEKDVDQQTAEAFGELEGYEDAPEFASKEAFRMEAEKDTMAGLLQSYLASGDDYYSEADLLAMPEDQRYKVLVEERDRRNKEAMIQEYVGSEPELQNTTIELGAGRTVDTVINKEKHDEAYLRTLDFNTLTDILYNERRDIVNKYTEDSDKSNEFVLTAVPKAIAPYVRVTGKGNGFVVVKPLAEIEDKVQENVLQQLREIKSEEVSDGKGAELKVYTPTKREESQAFVASVLQSVGMYDDSPSGRRKALQYATRFTGTRDTLGLADFALVGSVFGVEESIDEIKRLNNSEDATYGDYVAPSAVLGLSAVEAIPYIGLGAKYFKKGMKALPNSAGSKQVVDEAAEEVNTVVDNAVSADAARADRAKKKLNIFRAKGATDEVIEQQQIAAAQTAKDNPEIGEDIIKAYEAEHLPEGQTISKTVKVTLDDGTEVDRLVIDYEKVRSVSETRLNDIDLPDEVLDAAGFGPEGYRNPLLNPDKYDAVISIVAETKKLNPEAFKNADNTIEGLFDALVQDELLLTPEYHEVLSKYGLSLDDVVRLSIGSVHKAAKVMRKHRTISDIMEGRKLTAAEKSQKELDEAARNLGAFASGVRRLENITRGAVVSAFATAARNLQTTLIEFPIEGMTVAFDTVLHSVGKGKSVKQAFVDSRSATSNAFKMYGRMFSDPLEMKDYVAFMYKYGGKDGARMINRFYDQISEIQKATGRGLPREQQIARLMKDHEMSKAEATKLADNILSGKLDEKVGKVSDEMFSAVEDLVSVLNAPNRFQEHISRHTFMLQRIEQLVKKEYDADLFELMNTGRIGDLWNDTLPRPEGARKFAELMADATDYALRRTFAAPPKTTFFNQTLNVLNRPTKGSLPKRIAGDVTKFGARTVLLFPRFLFTSLEYMGALTPYELAKFSGRVSGRGVRKVAEKAKLVEDLDTKFVNLDVDDTEAIGRSMAGTTTLLTLYTAAYAGGITRDGKINIPFTDVQLDPMAMYPVAQLAWMANSAKVFIHEGRAAWNDWFNPNEFIKTFSGSNIKGNTGLGSMIDSWITFAAGEAKIGKTEQLVESIGEFTANVVTRPLQPYQMFLDAQRVEGTRSTTLKQYSSDPVMNDMGESFSQGFSRKLKERGFVSLEEEKNSENKNYPLSPDGKSYNYPAYKLALGLSVLDKYPVHKEYFLQYDLTDYDFTSKTGIDTVDNEINGILKDNMPSIAYSMAKYEVQLRNDGYDDTAVRRKIRARTMQLVGNIKSLVNQKATRAIGADDIPKVDALLALRNFTSDQQKSMIDDFEKVTGRPPNLNDTSDLRAILRIGRDSGFTKNLLK